MTAADIIAIVFALLLFGLVFLAKSKKYTGQHFRRRRDSDNDDDDDRGDRPRRRIR